MENSVCILISRAPYGTVSAAEGVRHFNGALNNGVKAVAALVDDGVWLARAGQTPGSSGFVALSDVLSGIQELPPASDPRVFVHGPSLARRGLADRDLLPGVEVVDDAGLARLIASTRHLLRF